MVMTLFDVAGFAMIGWGMMIFFPFWRGTKRMVEWTAFPVAVCGLYAVGLVSVFSANGLGLMAEFGSADGVLRVLRIEDVALIAWIHILAFDHLVAVFMFRDNQAHGVVPLPVQSALLFLTLMLGPLGFLTYWGVRVARGHGGNLVFVPAPGSVTGVDAARPAETGASA